MVGYGAEPVIGPRFARTRWRLTDPTLLFNQNSGANQKRAARTGSYFFRPLPEEQDCRMWCRAHCVPSPRAVERGEGKPRDAERSPP